MADGTAPPGPGNRQASWKSGIVPFQLTGVKVLVLEAPIISNIQRNFLLVVVMVLAAGRHSSRSSYVHRVLYGSCITDKWDSYRRAFCL